MPAAAATFKPDVIAPAEALLDRIESLLKHGVPGVTAEGNRWDGCAPEGHFLLPRGARVVRYEEAAEQQTGGFVILGYDQPAKPRVPRDPRFWDLYPVVEFRYARDAPWRDMRGLMREITRLLCADVRLTSTGAVQRARERLSSPELRVFDIKELDAEALKSAASHPALRVGFTVFCAGVAPSPAS